MSRVMFSSAAEREVETPGRTGVTSSRGSSRWVVVPTMGPGPFGVEGVCAWSVKWLDVEEGEVKPLGEEGGRGDGGNGGRS